MQNRITLAIPPCNSFCQHNSKVGWHLLGKERRSTVRLTRLRRFDSPSHACRCAQANRSKSAACLSAWGVDFSPTATIWEAKAYDRASHRCVSKHEKGARDLKRCQPRCTVECSPIGGGRLLVCRETLARSRISPEWSAGSASGLCQILSAQRPAYQRGGGYVNAAAGDQTLVSQNIRQRARVSDVL
ncbi:hypothetical protein Q31a_37240 [Aureliella helgolandensis]|uniref:Uncharacterized protein n=1 Tax=Aureliella helgolandensis TaxID=2527968 RepID=A0A518G9X6_9BACT|nr:hypothetical protein Q31a_37240 [Aureliella helgolandensis]